MNKISPPKARRTNVRWMIIGMAFLGTAINYIDRANLGVAEAYIRQETHLSKTQMGLVLSAFFWTYAICQLPAGWVVDRLGPRLTYFVACLWWSCFTALTAAGRSFASLVGIRGLLGVGEAGAYPSNAKAAAEWFPRQERALASAIFDSGSRVGTALALPIVSAVIAVFGWRASFLATSLLGVLWAFLWYSFYRSPGEHPWASAEEIAYIQSGGARVIEKAAVTRTQAQVKWWQLFRYRTVVGMALGFFCLTFVNYFFITWFPTYLREGRGFSGVQVGTYGMIPPLVGAAGGWCGGLASDWLVRRGLPLTVARKVPIVCGMLLSSAIGLAAIAPNAVLAVAWLSVSYASLSFAAASVWALPGDVAPTPAHVGSIGGIQNFASNLAGIVLPPMVGFLLDRTDGNFVVPLAMAGAAGILSALAYAFVVGPVEPLALPAES